MRFQEFADYHLPALEADEVRFNVQIGLIAAAAKQSAPELEHWSVGEPGHCAIRSPGRAILVGALERGECRQLVRAVSSIDYPGVMGSEQVAEWFAEQAKALGVRLDQRIPQRIHVLRDPPRYPNAEGSPRASTADDAPLLYQWMTQFHQEAVPHAPPPCREIVEKAAVSARYLFWTLKEEPVSVAAIARRSRATVAIASVYTPPERRGRGFAGSATASLAEGAFAEGKNAVCLYTDLRNPYSNRCYAKIGFKPYSDSLHYLRASP